VKEKQHQECSRKGFGSRFLQYGERRKFIELSMKPREKKERFLLGR
jgi:hypothetical protein